MKILKAILTFLLVGMGGLCFAQGNEKPLAIGVSTVLHSAILGEDRVVNVYLPAGYAANDTVKYPVIYVLDGAEDEDFVHIAGIVQFVTQPWIARFPSSIVVGIGGNTRRRDFTFAVKNTDFIEREGFKKAAFSVYGGSEKFMDFIDKELQLFIGKTYRASARKTVIGESFAGLLATELLLKRPHLFDDYIIISPSLWWGEYTLINDAATLLNAHLTRPVNVYLGVPNKAEDEKMHAASVRLAEQLQQHKRVHLVYDYMPDELHSTVIHQAVYNAFKKLYPKTVYGQ